MGSNDDALKVHIKQVGVLKSVHEQYLSKKALFVETQFEMEQNEVVDINLKLLSIRADFKLKAKLVHVQSSAGKQMAGFELIEMPDSLLSTIEAVLLDHPQEIAVHALPELILERPITPDEKAASGFQQARAQEARKIFTRGREKIVAGDLKGALSLVQQALKQDPNNAQYRQVLRELRKKVRS